MDKPGKNTVENIIKQLSYVQIDSIYSIARSQDLVLHSRSMNYQEEGIWKFLKKGKIFEGWAHARCLLPITELPFQYATMVNRRKAKPDWLRFVKDKNWQTKIIKQIENDGPISSADINPLTIDATFTGWNTFKKRLLDYLFFRGYIGVKYRKKLRVFYDLAENCFPKFDFDQHNLPTAIEIFWKEIEISLQALGIPGIHRLLHYRHRQSNFQAQGEKIQPRELIAKFVKEGKIVEFIDKTKRPKYHLPGFIDMVDKFSSTSEFHCHLLSPFDNSLWSRESLLEQYNFDFKMEIYVPKAKRRYGYFVLPILYGSEFVGRVDTTFDRKAKTMKFLKWSWQDNFIHSSDFTYELAKTINRFISFHHAENVVLGDFPRQYLDEIKAELSNDYHLIK